MSYSFSITAASKDDAGKAVEQELETIVGHQPVHATDRQAIQNAAEAFINLLVEPTADQAVKVDVYGSLGWQAENEFTIGNLGVTASIIAKPAALSSLVETDDNAAAAHVDPPSSEQPTADAAEPTAEAEAATA